MRKIELECQQVLGPERYQTFRDSLVELAEIRAPIGLPTFNQCAPANGQECPKM